MSSNLNAGQPFPSNYRLDRKVSDSNAVQTWIATNELTGDRAFVRVLLDSPDAARWSALTLTIDENRGLLHPNINLVREHGVADNHFYLIEPYIPSARPFSVTEDDTWSVLSQLIDALQYIHTLGIAHGNLHPGNLLIDARGSLHVTGIGIDPAWATSHNGSDFRSPQLADSERPTPADDIYSLGCLIYSALSGQTWRKAQQPGTALPQTLAPLIKQMMSDSAYDRTLGLTEIRNALARHYGTADGQIAAADFSANRAEAEGTRGDAAPAATPTRGSGGVSTRNVMIAAAATVLAAVLLFLVLPSGEDAPAMSQTTTIAAAPSPANTQPGNVQAPAGDIVTPLEAARLEAMQAKGETVAREILKSQLSLEDHGVTLWAADEYNSITEALEVADELFRSADFEAALDGYEHIEGRLAELKDQQTAVFEEKAALGAAALASGDQQTALEALTVARAIRPEEASIAAQLVRAENLGEVLSLMRQGEAQERNNELDEALSLFREARKLDAEWTAAGAAVERIEAALTRRDFQETMSRAFAAMSESNWNEARDLFQQAKSIMPESDEPADGLAQVDQAETREKIAKRRQEAENYFADGNWASAAETYEAILDISDSLEFARRGLEETLYRQDLDTSLTRYLSDPPLLQDDNALRDASRVLKDAVSVNSTDTDFQRRVDTLARLISTARIEIPVTITSDGKTLVTIRKHAELGQINAEVVFLIPGRYTITGVREGYRDVREELTLIAGRPAPTLSIASNERVR